MSWKRGSPLEKFENEGSDELSETAACEKRTHRRQKKITPTRVREIGGWGKGGREKGAHVGVDNVELRVLQG